MSFTNFTKKDAFEKDIESSMEEIKKETGINSVESSTETVENGVVIQNAVAEAAKPKFGRLLASFQRASPEELKSLKSNKKKMSNTDVLFIALATGLGTGLLVGSGKALNNGGPLGIIIAMIIAAFTVLLTILGAGELSVSYSGMNGGFNAYTIHLVDPSFGFAVAWGYAINWFTVLPLEMVTAAMTIKYWLPDVNSDVFVSSFLVLVYGVNFIFGARGYSTFEKVCGSAKILMMVTFLIAGFVFISGGGPTHVKHNAEYYYDPGMFANGFKGICLCFVTFAFSLGGTEFLALTAPDQREPRKAIPKAVKLVSYRLVFFYLATVIVIGFLVPYNSPDLMGAEKEKNSAPVSPFVLACDYSGVPALGHVINAIICIAVVSVGNSALYSSSNTFNALSEQGLNFKYFNYKDKHGRPLRAMLVSATFGLFSFIAAYEDQESIFVWLLSLSGLATIFTWISINLSHICFIRACKAQGLDRDTLGYKSPLDVYGSYVALALNIFFLCVHFWVSLFPLNNDGKADVKNFFQNYMGFFTFLMLFLGHKVYNLIRGKKTNWFCNDPRTIDLDANREIYHPDLLARENKEDKIRHQSMSLPKKVLKFWC